MSLNRQSITVCRGVFSPAGRLALPECLIYLGKVRKMDLDSVGGEQGVGLFQYMTGGSIKYSLIKVLLLLSRRSLRPTETTEANQSKVMTDSLIGDPLWRLNKSCVCDESAEGPRNLILIGGSDTPFDLNALTLLNCLAISSRSCDIVREWMSLDGWQGYISAKHYTAMVSTGRTSDTVATADYTTRQF